MFQKLRESALAYHLERRWSKDKILTEYLNSIYFGEGAYGIEAAAQTYFQWNHPGCGGEKPLRVRQAPPEAALLAGMISSPSAYPRASSPRPRPRAAPRAREMVEQGMLTPDQYTDIVGDGSKGSGIPIPTPDQISPPDEHSASPYFTTWLRQQVVDRYGAGEAFGGGLQITSTIDLSFQQAVEEIAYSKLAAIGPPRRSQCSTTTGGVLAMVGGDDREGAVQPRDQRPPPAGIRVQALHPRAGARGGPLPNRGVHIAAEGVQFRPPGPVKSEIFEVKNYEDSYLGSASLATATQYSDNSVFAELGLNVGTEDVAATAEKMGIQTDVSTNPAMLLGGLEQGVSPLEMAYAYSTLGRSGQRIGGTMDSVPGKLGPTAISKVTLRDDETRVVEDKRGRAARTTSRPSRCSTRPPRTPRWTCSRTWSRGNRRSAATGDFAWGKTGTTDDNGDAWFCGGTEDITACVWVGYADSYTPMKTEFAGGPVDGGTYPALIWHDIVTAYESIIGSAKEEDKGGRRPRALPRMCLRRPQLPPRRPRSSPPPRRPPSPLPRRPAAPPRTPRQHCRAADRRRNRHRRHRSVGPAGAAEQLDRVSSRAGSRATTRSGRAESPELGGPRDPDPRRGRPRLASRHAPPRPASSNGGPSRLDPLSASPTSSASVSLPGLEHSSRVLAPAAGALVQSMRARAPGSAPPRPGPRAHTAFSRLWIPYEIHVGDARPTEQDGVSSVRPMYAWHAGSSAW